MKKFTAVDIDVQHFDRDAYDRWLEGIAKATADLDEDPRTAAETCIVATKNLDEEKALLFDAYPFADGRAAPTDVLICHHRYPFDAKVPDGLLELAVHMLEEDIMVALEMIEQLTGEGYR